MFELCKDAKHSQEEAIAKCVRPGERLPRFKLRCTVENESCAWLVDCPGLNGRVFKGTQSRERARFYASKTLIEKRKDKEGNKACIVKHEQWTFVCCGYFCT